MRRIAAVAFILAFTATACTTGGTHLAHVVTLDEPLPTISGHSVTDGSTLSTADYRGKVLVVNVWANWCGPCQYEQPDLVKVANAYSSKGVEFLGINYQDQDAKARAWINKYHVPYPSLADPSGRSALQLKFSGLPDTIIVDPSGTERYLFFGRTSEAEVSHYLDVVLASPSVSASP
jgi:thiol-disulfide isomerase/thioredoxin